MSSISYLTVYFSSEGVEPSQIVKVLRNMGFEPTTGGYDFMYDWKREVDVLEAIDFTDQVFFALKRTKVTFKIETIS